jgi:ComF family protein
VVRLSVYAEPLRSLIHAMKYHGRWWVSGDLAERLRRKPEISALLARADIVTSVPLHWRRQVQRGFNQSELIARSLERAKFRRVLVRLVPTPPQSLQDSRASRMMNLRDAFALVRPATVAGKHVVLVDDVMTTGATLRSAARALQAGRPSSISAVVVAVADPKGRDFRSL